MIPLGAEVFCNPSNAQDKSRPHQFATKVVPGMFIGYALNSGGGWTTDLIIAAWPRHREQRRVRSSREKVEVHRSSDQKSAGSIFFPCADGSLRQEGHAQRQSSRQRRVESFDAGGGPSTLGEARSDLLQRAWSDVVA